MQTTDKFAAVVAVDHLDQLNDDLMIAWLAINSPQTAEGEYIKYIGEVIHGIRMRLTSVREELYDAVGGAR
ncbi:hypothetical protein [Aliihoeflea sp. PC F10.4]